MQLLLILFGEHPSRSQTLHKRFHKLSRPEKRWVFTHPFVAKKALLISKKALQVADSISKTGIIGDDNNGGKPDAFKHAYWMATLATGIGHKKALQLGRAHEKGNYLQFKKRKLEDALLPDSVSCLMDLNNNAAGIDIPGNCKNLSEKTIEQKVMIALSSGQLYIIKKDTEGNYLYCDEKKIAMKEWYGKWGIPKCLIPSNSY